MTVLQIIDISFILFLISIFLYKKKKLILNIKEIILLLTSSLILVFLSLFVFKVKIGGTIMSRLHGWPHFFYFYNIKEIIDNTRINQWNFTPGPFYIYIVSNYLFYLSSFLFITIFIKIQRKR